MWKVSEQVFTPMDKEKKMVAESHLVQVRWLPEVEGFKARED